MACHVMVGFFVSGAARHVCGCRGGAGASYSGAGGVQAATRRRGCCLLPPQISPPRLAMLPDLEAFVQVGWVGAQPRTARPA